MTKRRIALLTALLLALGLTGVAAASPAMLDPFTEDELDDNWAADRQFPSGGVASVQAFDRDDVARIGIDVDEVHPTSPYHRTEGIKSPHGPADNFDEGGDFGQAVQVDLYLDPDWQGNAVRAGLWVVGDDGAGFIDWVFGILEFANVDGHEGFRIWHPLDGGWTDTGIDFDYGQWATLLIELDTENGEYHFSVDGEPAGTMPANVSEEAESSFIRNIILNHFNFGANPEPGLSNVSYDVHWHNGDLGHPTDKDDCKDGGWDEFGFSNQGQCIRFVNTGKDSR